MNIIEAAKALKAGKTIALDEGRALWPVHAEDGLVVSQSGIPGYVYVEELLSDKWSVVDEQPR